MKKYVVLPLREKIRPGRADGRKTMKKRVLSALLSLVLVVSLAAGLGVTAYADDATITYTLKSGDTVAKVCQDLGIDFVKNYAWITATNNITNYSALPVGKVLILPAPGTVATAAATPATTTTVAPGTVVAGTTTSPVVVPAAGTATTGDAVAYYLIAHTLKSGETVYSVCNTYGIKFDANANTISKLNNITSWTNLKVGQVLLLPSTTPPASGDYYRIVAHKVVSGDTVVAICSANGIEYGKNIDMLKALNNKNDLTSIKVGETFYVPIKSNAGGTVPAGTVVPGTGTVTPGTGTVTPAAGGTAAATPTPAGTVPTIKYTMKSGDTVAKVCQSLGIDFYKNYGWITNINNITDYSKIYVGQVLTLPAPGTIANGAAPAGGGSGTVTPTGGGSVTPSSSGAYSLHTSSNGTYVLQVGGQVVNTANQGQTVTVVPIPDYGYALESISVTKTGAADRVAVTNNSFVMPGYPVSIVVTFKPAG